MPHYLIRISASPAAAEQIMDQPRESLNAARDASKELGGHLDGCWFTDGGEELIALLHLPHDVGVAVLRESFRRILDGADVEVQGLLTLRDLESQVRGEDVLVRDELWSDPVDLGSDLSFPASDPPGWMNRERIASSEGAR